MLILLSYGIRVLDYLVMQYLLIFKCVNIEHKRKPLFAITIVYSVVYITICYVLGVQDDFDTSMTLQILYQINHTLNTFILLIIIAVGSSEFLPRNFLIATFYYDFLTLLPWPHEMLVNFILDKYAAASTYIANSIYSNQPIMVICVIISYSSLALDMFIVYLLFNRRLKQLIAKIPGYICTFAFIFTFIMYVFKCIYEVSAPVNFTGFGSAVPDLTRGLSVFSVTIAILLIVYTVNKSSIKRIQEADARFLYGYYSNLTGIYNELRHLRHDLANHMAVLESSGSRELTAYRTSLLSTCSGIQEKVAKQLAWQSIDVDILSSREKLEIHRFMQTLAQKLKKDGFDIEMSKSSDDRTVLSFVIRDIRCNPLKVLLLKARTGYQLVKAIAGQHLGKAGLKISEEGGKKMHDFRFDLVTVFAILLLFCLFAVAALFRINRNLKRVKQEFVSSWQKQNEYMDRNVEFCLQAEDISGEIYRYIEQQQGVGAEAEKQYMERCTELMRYMHGGSSIEESLIAEKKAKCEQEGIGFIDEIGVLPNGKMRETDVVSLLGNLLDNAIEACRLSGFHQPFVKVNTRQKKNALIINITNSKNEDIELKTSEMKTTKDDAANHGLGLDIVRNIVSLYNGTIKMADKGSTFEVSVLVFMKKEKVSGKRS